MVLDKIKELLVDQLDVDPDSITLDSVVTDDLGADSLDIVDLIMTLEDEFDMEIPDEDVEGMRTVGDIVDFIESNDD